MQQYEAGKHRISASRLMAIAAFLDRPAAFFLAGEEACCCGRRATSRSHFGMD
jgi:transcriptional regulator with XRE-family HTH domain